MKNALTLAKLINDAAHECTVCCSQAAAGVAGVMPLDTSQDQSMDFLPNILKWPWCIGAADLVA